jgi:hypothetical protein
MALRSSRSTIWLQVIFGARPPPPQSGIFFKGGFPPALTLSVPSLSPFFIGAAADLRQSHASFHTVPASAFFQQQRRALQHRLDAWSADAQLHRHGLEGRVGDDFFKGVSGKNRS